MNNQIKDGGPAFPHQDSGDTGTRPGMSLRDYFAAHIIQGMFANPALFSPTGGFNMENFDGAWIAADRMLRANGKAKS